MTSVMPIYEEGPGRVLLEGTEEERQQAEQVAEEAWKVSDRAHEEYMQAFNRWQDGNCQVGEKTPVEETWLRYTEAYNQYLEVHRGSAGKYGGQPKPPYLQQHGE